MSVRLSVTFLDVIALKNTWPMSHFKHTSLFWEPIILCLAFFLILPAIKESPEGIWNHAHKVQEVEFEVFHCLQAIE